MTPIPGRRVRPMEAHELAGTVDYFLNGDDHFLVGMGVDLARLPDRSEWYASLEAQHAMDDRKKERFYVAWERDHQVVGHSNINEIRFGIDAYMHLHLWHPGRRRRGDGTFFVRQSIEIYFERFQLDRLFCQPFADNPAPNRTLPKVGFEFVTRYYTRPGSINLPQFVNLWVMERSNR